MPHKFPLYACLLCGSWLAFACPSTPLVIAEETTQKETTRITGPLTAEGYIDFFKAMEEQMYPPEIATDENGFRIFLRLFGDAGDKEKSENSEFYRLQKYKKLGLDPNIPPTLVFPDEPSKVIKDFCEAKGYEIPPGDQITVGSSPWTLKEYPMLTDWIKEIDVPMDAVAEAIRKPLFFPPPLLQRREEIESGEPPNLDGVLLPDIQFSRSIARIFQARAMYRIGQGNIDGAIDDKLTLHRLGRLLPHKGCAVQHFVGVAIEGMAMTIPLNANPDHPLTEQQIRRLLDGLAALPPRAPLTDVYKWERFTSLSAIQYVKIQADAQDQKALTEFYNNMGLPSRLFHAALSSSLKLPPFNWDTVYNRVNEFYDAMLEPPPRAKFHAMRKEVKMQDKWKLLTRTLLTPDGRETLAADMILEIMVSALEDILESTRQCSECLDNMQRLAWAVLLYQLENGKMPYNNWAVQIEKYLGTDPGQYFSCPSNPSLKGKTTYALIHYGGRVPGSQDTLLLIELAESVPLDRAIVSVEEVLEHKRVGSAHPGAMVVAHRNGAVRMQSLYTSDEEWLRLLRRKVE